MESLRKRICDALIETRDGNVDDSVGICTNVYDKIFEALDLFTTRRHIDGLLTSAAEAWPKYSGSSHYPVPGGEHAYHYSGRNKWDRSTEYGRLRWELLDHMIDYFNCPDEEAV